MLLIYSHAKLRTIKVAFSLWPFTAHNGRSENATQGAVHTSNIVEATFDFVEATFDIVERIVQLVAFDNVAWILSLVWTGLKVRLRHDASQRPASCMPRPVYKRPRR